LTTAKDLLSQWRGYCPNGGCSISFNKEQLQSLLQHPNLEIYECLYDDDKKKQFIKDKIIGVSPDEFARSLALPQEQSANMCIFDQRVERFAKNFKLLERDIRKFAAIMKDSAFSEEKEWRIVTNETYSGLFMGFPDIGLEPLPFNIKKRERKNKTIPYIELLLGDDNTPLIIDEIVFRPNSDKTDKINLRRKIEDNQPNIDFKITDSIIPYID
jgi:hypothetical protein